MFDLKYNADGLIPAIVQDHYTKKVLMLAYMNEESLKISMEEGRTCFSAEAATSSGARAKPPAMCRKLFRLKPTATAILCWLM